MRKQRAQRFIAFFLSLSLLLVGLSQHASAQATNDSLLELSLRWTHFEKPPEPTASNPETSPENTYPIETQSPDSNEPIKPVYLTFDDGPDPNWTPKVLSLLNRYNAKATFYMLGRNVASYPELVVDLAKAGQSLANHSFNHPSFNSLSYEAIGREVGDTTWVTRNALTNHPELANQVVSCVRPPYGEANGGVYNALWGLGYNVSMWDLDTMDWQQPAPATILQQVLAQIETHRVILMHDGGENRQSTIESLALILHELTMQGYRFEPYCTQNGQANFTP